MKTYWFAVEIYLLWCYGTYGTYSIYTIQDDYFNITRLLGNTTIFMNISVVL